METSYIITGTSSGIGEALANLLLTKNKGSILGIARHQTITHEKYQHLTVDLSKTISESLLQDVEKFLKDKKSKRLILVNNAGTVSPIGHIGTLNNIEIENSFYINSIAPFILSNAIVAYSLKQQIPLKILNIGTGASTNPIDGWSAYCASKAALKMLTEVWRKEVDHKNWDIQVLEYSPGVIDTPMQSEIRDSSSDQFSRVDQFKKFKSDNLLESPATTAEKIYQVLN